MKGLLGSSGAESRTSHLAEIDEELLFHLRSRVEDNRAAGMNEDEAWDDARRRLGSYRSSVEECEEIRTAGWKRLGAAIAAAALFLFAFGWITIDWRAKALAAQQTVISHQLGMLTTALHQTAAPPAAEPQDLVTLVTYKGQPVQDAEVLLMLKTWPDNRYRQQPFHAKTGADGKARFERLIPATGQFAVHAAVISSDRAMTSAYHLFKADQRDFKKITPLEFELTDARTIRFRLKDEDGKPLVNAHVAPAYRKTKKSGKEEEHLVYYDASGPATVSSDSQGEVTFSCFASGDAVKLFVTAVGQPPIQAECKIPMTGDAVDVTVKPGR